ncbi:UbiX family flavin prenyltransferase [Campylobacter insulaenigrae]|uniref:UbiX family flavin prenyltransferase n=1 Tax=Campylobacter insulaenigrae TaxID=260714 RepID=A0ABY3G2E2_9BACT|nr:UbiX family flavin prenyltransferase [Campylobacter insulaenigrae]MCR6570116.1 UbiX family flavin prenyltransferase [Campylobacter insulaenigrae]MCR6571901.1 UbiX family flavin prenyltransferase [Campylobacter insulaenigrae]MCR6573159.1 UbiX family flavin prenyltransferase [Campylobacter insulaenigrae]MCR6576372.1 UbiX family flavin prenyltransferase [Campylobacter insulaenigrae]MCR6580394.1 UbiX family flavin prenyltransferase [Campylobacter insulaenigrae]
MRKILVNISGASSCELGFLLLKYLQDKGEIFAIISDNAKISFTKENSEISINNFMDAIKQKFKLQNIVFLENDNISECVASGSFGIETTFITPCSINTLAKISCGICDNLITRSAAVALKERKKMILGVREMPYSSISLEQMTKLSYQGVIIAPPVMASYAKVQNLDELKKFIIGKWLDLADIKHELYKRWQ